MAEIEYSESHEIRRVEYYGENNQCITLRVVGRGSNTEFTCFWTPKIPPFDALTKLLNTGFIPRRTSKGQAEFKNSSFTTRHWKQAFNRARALRLSDLEHLELGTDSRCIALERSPYGNSLCCGMGGELEMLPFLGTALTLTAPYSLIIQYAAMRSRLVGPNREEYMQTIRR